MWFPNEFYRHPVNLQGEGHLQARRFSANSWKALISVERRARTVGFEFRWRKIDQSNIVPWTCTPIRFHQIVRHHPSRAVSRGSLLLRVQMSADSKVTSIDRHSPRAAIVSSIITVSHSTKALPCGKLLFSIFQCPIVNSIKQNFDLNSPFFLNFSRVKKSFSFDFRPYLHNLFKLLDFEASQKEYYSSLSLKIRNVDEQQFILSRRSIFVLPFSRDQSSTEHL